MRKTPVKKAKYLVIDTETSGVKAWENGLIQLGAIALDSQMEIVEEFNYYVLPPENLVWDENAAKVHNISKQTLIESGLSYTDVCQKFIVFIKNNFNELPITIAQFFPFDYAFLDRVFDIAFPDYRVFQDVISRNFIDTKSLANVFNLKSDLLGKPKFFTETSLSKVGGLKDALSLPRSNYNAHDALSDCRATRDVLIKLIDLIDIPSI
jgi:DNA polymerase III epsilon subunit-like protein